MFFRHHAAVVEQVEGFLEEIQRDGTFEQELFQPRAVALQAAGQLRMLPTRGDAAVVNWFVLWPRLQGGEGITPAVLHMGGKSHSDKERTFRCSQTWYGPGTLAGCESEGVCGPALQS